MTLSVKRGAPIGTTSDDIDTFCRIIGNGLAVTLAGSQIGLGPNESTKLANLYAKEINRRRRKSNAKPTSETPTVIKPRDCLTCSETFISHHFGERVCPSCKSTVAWRSGGVDDLSLSI